MTSAERAELETLRAEVNGKLDILIERTSNLQKIDADHEDRLRLLERWKYAIPPTVIVVAGSLIFEFFKGGK